MSLKVFLELVEIKAKTASVLPFLLGLCFSFYYYHQVDWTLSTIFFIAMFLFNMAVDILDNYNDYHHAVDIHDYKQNTNIIGREKLNPKVVFAWLSLFTLIAALLGIYLVYRTGLGLLFLGIFCFFIGIAYSSGPKPLSALPLGEVFSGFTMGFMITLISVYVNTSQNFSWSWTNLGIIFLISLPNVLWIANLMLANNLCDYHEDQKNNRKTLVHYLGIKRGLNLFLLNNIIAYASIILSVGFKLLPPTLLIVLLLSGFTLKQTKKLFAKQVKRETFSCAVKILAINSSVLTIIFGITCCFIALT